MVTYSSNYVDAPNEKLKQMLKVVPFELSPGTIVPPIVVVL